MQGSRINGMGYVADPFPHLGLAYHLIAERLANSQTVQRFCILFKKKKMMIKIRDSWCFLSFSLVLSTIKSGLRITPNRMTH